VGVRGRAAAVLLVVVSISLAGCASLGSQTVPTTAPTDAEHVSTQISSLQKKDLSDGTVTQDEYNSAFEHYKACLAKAGFEIIDNGVIDNVRQYLVPQAAEAGGVDDRCYVYNFGQVDAAWQIAHQDSSQEAADYRACLVGLKITPATTLVGMQAQIDKVPARERCGLP
jgi:hypothetical protein